LVFEKNAIFCRKLAKIAENCDHNIDPRSELAVLELMLAEKVSACGATTDLELCVASLESANAFAGEEIEAVGMQSPVPKTPILSTS
jgi:hypothetical protein